MCRNGQFTTDWINIQKGVLPGCTIFPIVFIMGMNLLIAAAEDVTCYVGVVYRPAALRGFMDDITTTVSHDPARWVLETLDNHSRP